MKNCFDFIASFSNFELYIIKKEINQCLNMLKNDPTALLPIKYKEITNLTKQMVWNNETHIFNSYDQHNDSLISIESKDDNGMLFDYFLLPEINFYDYSFIASKIENLLFSLSNKFTKRTFNVIFYYILDNDVQFKFVDLKSFKKINNKSVANNFQKDYKAESMVTTDKITVKAITKTNYSKFIYSPNFKKNKFDLPPIKVGKDSFFDKTVIKNKIKNFALKYPQKTVSKYQTNDYTNNEIYDLKNNRKMLFSILKSEMIIDKKFSYEIFIPKNVYDFFLLLIFKYDSCYKRSCKENLEAKYFNLPFFEAIEFEKSIEINVHCLDLFVMFFADHFSKNLFFDKHALITINSFRSLIEDNVELNFLNMVKSKSNLIFCDYDYFNEQNYISEIDYFKTIARSWISIANVINKIINLNILYYKSVPKEFDEIFNFLLTEMKNRSL